MIRFNCLRCGASLSAPEDCVGRSSKCKCGQQLTVPAASGSPLAPTGPIANAALDQVDVGQGADSTAMDKAAIFQAPTVAPEALPAGRVDVGPPPTVAPAPVAAGTVLMQAVEAIPVPPARSSHFRRFMPWLVGGGALLLAGLVGACF